MCRRHCQFALGKFRLFHVHIDDIDSISTWVDTILIDDTNRYTYRWPPWLDRPEIKGVQALYSWKSLEPQKDEYDFSHINNDLRLVQNKGKQLWVQVQDRTFSNNSNPVPKYLHAPIYTNGSVPQCDGSTCDEHYKIDGWVAVQWNEHVRQRFQSLLKAMSTELDGRIYGMNLAETAIIPEVNKNNFTYPGYFAGELENAAYAASVFHKSYVVQYANFWPCKSDDDAHEYFSQSFEFFAKHGVGIGGPDLIPYKPAQENASYPFLFKYRNKVPISVIAVQEPDLHEVDRQGHKFTRQDFTDYAVNKLGSQIIFWTEEAPWLN